MLQFQPPGFGQKVIKTSLGAMAYYTPIASPWRTLNSSSPFNHDEFPPLVFLHSLGGGSSAYEWSKVYPAFAPRYCVIAPDLIGWGQSAHPVRTYRVEDYFTILTEMLEAIGSPVPVVASSLTAGITIRLAIQRPDLFKMLFLVSPAGYADFGADYGRNVAAQIAGIPGVDQVIYALGAANEIAVRNFLEQFLFADRSRLTQETVEAYLASAQQPNAAYAALASLRGDLCFDLSLYMSQLTVPTAIVWSEASRFGTVETGERLAKLSEAVKWVWTIANAGVLPQLETPATVTGLLLKALKMQSV
ncbi:MAG: alpha/beta hydrolase [Timaviella obliquedivisa GSE-PSE-MK23-08B]|jgi:pimeloyl-ACP methyl ester carboxylesterase|nr:alpha/beta hydrolase [Timaviella obliquedivisa GSE-PSE-MK23-08B]